MRKLVILKEMPSSLLLGDGGIFLSAENFHKAKQYLGREYPFVLYDMQAENGINFNLEAFAIVAGTISQGGVLYLLCPNWEKVETLLDFDALRWNEKKAIACPNFYTHFKELADKFEFTTENSAFPLSLPQKDFIELTDEQQKILENLPHDPADIHLLTAPRGRGKSTVAGRLAEKIARSEKVYITARSHSVLPSFWQTVESEQLQFVAPDKLIALIEQQNIETNAWLFVDEAASLPLPLLQTFCDYFHKVVLITTTKNYEGTGRGFELKLPKALQRIVKNWVLSKPLRYLENDPLEKFIDELLVLNFHPTPSSSKKGLYALLAEAHYKTTPNDLRRLLDGDNQTILTQAEHNELIGGLWAVKEGGLDEELSQAIWRGERRPQGSLVAQYLCYQGNLPEACRLNSIRISRIAVKTERQNQGIGKRLISDFILQISVQKQPIVDFVSVSFGLNEPLYHFWETCGFELVQITPSKEASSGLHSAMMLYPVTEKGKRLVNEAKQVFQADFGLQPFVLNLQLLDKIRPLACNEISERDWLNINGFAYHNRTVASCYVSLKRLYAIYPTELDFLTPIFKEKKIVPIYSKQCKGKIGDFLKCRVELVNL